MGNFTLEKNMNTKVLAMGALVAFAYAQDDAKDADDKAAAKTKEGDDAAKKALGISTEKAAPRSHWVASMLALSGTGFTGIDRFYLGYVWMGIVKAVTFGGFGIWTLIDQIFITHCWLVDAWGQVMQGCRA